MNMRDGPPALNWRALELVYPQLARQHREPRARWSDEAVDHIRSILAGDGHVWAGITVRLQPTRKGGDAGGFAYSIDYDGKVMLASAVCIDARTADRYWGYASMVKPTPLWEKSNEGRPPVTRPVSVPWMFSAFSADGLALPKSDWHLWRLMMETNVLAAWALID